MRDFEPTRPPFGRLARLGVVVDPSDARALTTARLCDRAGIDVIWIGRATSGVMTRPAAGSIGPAVGRLVADILSGERRARLGGLVDAGESPPAFVDEVWISGPTAEKSAGSARLSATAESGDDVARLLAVVDDIVLPGWLFPDLESAADAVRAESADAGRDPATLGVAALVPVSIGRTEAEASARADADPVFRAIGHPREVGIFGTLEECQDRVIALAHAGIADLRCILPGTPDVHDVIAQLTSMTIGTVEVLIPGSLRSAAPPPPDGWGGRPDVPPRPRVSGGSRRR